MASNEKRYAEYQNLFEQIIDSGKKTLSSDNLNIGVAQIKLGRIFMAQARYRNVELHTAIGY